MGGRVPGAPPLDPLMGSEMCACSSQQLLKRYRFLLM